MQANQVYQYKIPTKLQQTTKIICTQFCTPLRILARNPPKSAQVRESPKPLATQALSPISRNSPDAHKRPETALARLGDCWFNADRPLSS